MHIKLEKSTFVKILGHCQNVVEKKSTMPILSHILLNANAGSLSVAATDLDMEFTATVPVDFIQDGKACVSASLLFDIVKKLPEKNLIELKLDNDGSRLIITSGRSRFDLGCLNSEDFPDLSRTELTQEFSIPTPVLKHLIESTRHFISNEEVRYNMSGIFFHTHEGDQGEYYLRAVSSDMHRLACVQCIAPDGVMDIPPAIVSRKTVNEILKLLEDADLNVDIGISSARIELKISNNNYAAKLTARLIDGVFPDYNDALHVPDDKKLIVNTKEFSESIDRVGSVVTVSTSNKIRAIRLTVNSTVAVLAAVSEETGSAVEDIDVSYSSDQEVEISCNVRYLLDVLQQIKTEEVELWLQDRDSSILIRPVNDPNMVYILMPMEC